MFSAQGCPLRPGDAARFAAFRDLLEKAPFTEKAIAAHLGIEDLTGFVPLRKGRSDQHGLACPIDALIRLFLDEDPVAETDLRRLLPGALELMQPLGLVAPFPGENWYATVSLYPVGTLYIVSDRSSLPDHSPFKPLPDAVYPVSEQTRFFLETLPPDACERLLDIGAGTGIAALAAAAGYAGHAWAFDIAPRATAFAEFNRRLNGLDNVTAACGALYEPAAGQVFDRIVAHPPYVPVGEATYIFRDGGEDGEQVTRGIIEGLPRYLAPGGRFYGFCMASDREGEFFEQRIRRWLGDASAEFDVLLVAWATVTPDSINSPLSTEERQHWARIYEACRVKYLFHGSIVVERHAAPRPPFTVRTLKGPQSGWRETEWLRRWMAAASGGDVERLVLASRPALSSRVELRVTHRVRNERLVPEECTLLTTYPFDTECVCQPWIAQVVSGCDGRVTGWDHFANCLRQKVLRPECAPADFARVLCGMVSGGFLELPEFPLPLAAETTGAVL